MGDGDDDGNDTVRFFGDETIASLSFPSNPNPLASSVPFPCSADPFSLFSSATLSSNFPNDEEDDDGGDGWDDEIISFLGDERSPALLLLLIISNGVLIPKKASRGLWLVVRMFFTCSSNTKFSSRSALDLLSSGCFGGEEDDDKGGDKAATYRSAFLSTSANMSSQHLVCDSPCLLSSSSMSQGPDRAVMLIL